MAHGILEQGVVVLLEILNLKEVVPTDGGISWTVTDTSILKCTHTT